MSRPPAPKEFPIHKNKNIKPENKLMYAKDTIKTAERLYRRYQEPHPNPLNIDDKDLEPDARACWEYIFTNRDYSELPEYDPSYYGSQRERVFENADEVIFAFESYIAWVKNNNFVKTFARPDGELGIMPIIPNQSNLARWLGISSQRIYAIMQKSEDARNKYKRMLADCLSEGAMAGVYQPASTIFSLKNMCDWADKYEDRSRDKADDLGVTEAAELMKQLGYSREKATLEAPKPMLEGDVDG